MASNVAYKVRRPQIGNQWAIFQHIKDAYDAELCEMEVGDKITIECVEMTEEALNALPEFEGW